MACGRCVRELRDITGGSWVFPGVAWLLVVVMAGVLMYGVSMLRAATTIESIVLTACFGVGEAGILCLAILLTYISWTHTSSVVSAQQSSPPATTAIAPRQLPTIPEEETAQFTQANPIPASVSGRSK